MDETPVVDTSPLIHLARADRLSLLTILHPTIVVPFPVLEEIEVPDKDRKVRDAVRGSSWLVPVSGLLLSAEVAGWDLGRGEAAVLEWARQHPGALAILDDARGRRCARALGVPVIGTVGLVVRARSLGRIPRVRPVLEELVAGGMYLSRTVLEEALSRLGE